MEPTMYQICVQGRLTERLAAALEGMTLHGGAVNTVFTGEIERPVAALRTPRPGP